MIGGQLSRRDDQLQSGQLCRRCGGGNCSCGFRRGSYRRAAADQEKQVYDLSLKYSKKMREIFQSSSGDREAMRGKMAQVREERDNEFKKVLNEEQFKGYQKIQEERRQQMRQRRGGG